MRRVHLLLTGVCERNGLPDALARLFAPRVDVQFVSAGEFDSFTSGEISVRDLGRVDAHSVHLDGPVDKLARALVRNVLEGECDLVVAIDDLELVNENGVEDVRGFFRAAVEREIDGKLTISQQERLAKRASFHLLAPMVEAYFYGETDAIGRALDEAGVDPWPAWSIACTDLEKFATTDAEFLDREKYPDLSKEQRRKKSLAWRTADRQRHPKRYLEYLCRDGSLGYREGRSGVAALRGLAFEQVSKMGVPLLRQMLADVEEALELDPVLGEGVPPRAARVLRNL